MKKISADKIFTAEKELLSDHVIIVENDGTILSIDKKENHDKSSIQSYHGTLIPGFVNTHCHLELSHMKGLVPTGTGLIPFISKVVQFRDFPQEEIRDAIKSADKEMYQNGIVAVGDICNKLDTKQTKDDSSLAYYSFVEVFDFLQDSMTDNFFVQYLEVFKGQSDRGANKKSLVPHAPYSVSAGLFAKINQHNSKRSTISIHNQECRDENDLFLSKTGELLPFYESMGFKMDHFQATGHRSIAYALQYLDADQKTLMVHNTVCDRKDIEMAQSWNDKVYWVTCPNANLYIENNLPDYQLFIDLNAKMTIGTDSLCSNWQLDIWEEIKTIKKYNSYIDLEQLLTWATINGAESLDYHHFLGSIKPGKKPGINLINHVLGEDENDLEHIQSKKII